MTIVHPKCVLKYRLRIIKKPPASTHDVLTRKAPTLLEKRRVKRHHELTEVMSAHARLRTYLKSGITVKAASSLRMVALAKRLVQRHQDLAEVMSVHA